MDQPTTTQVPIVISQYEKLQNDIAIAEKSSEGLAFDYRDPKQNKAARSHVFALRTIKGEIERARKEAKAYALDYGRRVDSAAKELETKVEALILPHETEIKKIDREEAERKAGHQTVVDRLIAVRTQPMESSAAVAETMEKIKAFDTSSLQEYKAKADEERFATVLALEKAYAEAVKREAEAAELARLRKEAAEREEAELVARIKAEAVEKERQRVAEIERKRIAEEAAAKAKAEAKARAEQEQAERERRAAIEAAERKQLEAQLAQERAERAAAEAKANEERMRAEMAAAEAREKQREEEAKRIAAQMEARKQQVIAERAANREKNRKQLAEFVFNLLPSLTPAAIAEAILDGDIPGVSFDAEEFAKS